MKLWRQCRVFYYHCYPAQATLFRRDWDGHQPLQRIEFILPSAIYSTLIGQTVASQLLKTLKLRPDMNLTLDDWVVMPIHFHAILWIGNNPFKRHSGPTGQPFGPQSKNLASLLRGFKSAVTAQAIKNNLEFGWQERY